MENMNTEDVIVTLELEDGSKVECIVITLFEAQGKEYAALMPKDEADDDDPEVVFYRVIQDGDDDILESIEDDEEYEIAEDAFDELLDNIEFDEMEKNQ